MSELQRITTEFIESEDRIRLSGEFGPSQAVVLWLTQRLASRLVPHLCNWLETRTASTPGAPVDIVQGFAQQAALVALAQTHQPPVRPDRQTQSWLVQTVDITTGEQVLTLRFKAQKEGAEVARLSLKAQALRQWLGILQQQYRRAGWPEGVWPDWVAQAEPKGQTGSGPTAVLH